MVYQYIHLSSSSNPSKYILKQFIKQNKLKKYQRIKKRIRT